MAPVASSASGRATTSEMLGGLGSNTRPRALLVGDASLLWHLPPVLRSAGLDVDAVTVRSPYFRFPARSSRRVRCESLQHALRTAASWASAHRYALIVVADDMALRMLRDDPGLTDEQRVRLGPVARPEDLGHLGSKVEMIQRLAEAGVPVPASRPVASAAEAVSAGEVLGWPLVLKGDSGSGGRQVRIVGDERGVVAAWSELVSAHAAQEARYPPDYRQPLRVLAQAHATGNPMDLSAFFRDGTLVHHTQSRALADVRPLGASSVRLYRPSVRGDRQVATELSAIGAALGLDGFANISALERPDGSGRTYFEVDARPNLWTHVGAQVGDDPVVRLRRWFADGSIDLGPTGPVPSEDQIVRMANRTSRRDLLRNADGVLADLSWGTPDAALFLASALLRGPVSERRR